jgi:hypothetical protein
MARPVPSTKRGAGKKFKTKRVCFHEKKFLNGEFVWWRESLLAAEERAAAGVVRHSVYHRSTLRRDRASAASTFMFFPITC